MFWLVPLFTSAAILALFIGIYVLTGTEAKVESRLEAVPALENRKRAKGGRQKRLADSISQRVARLSIAEQISAELTRANIKLTVSEYIMLQIGIMLAGFLLGVIVTRKLIPGIALGAMAGYFPRFYVHRRQAQRFKAFQEQLPDVLNLLISALKAGHGLLHALELVAQEMPNPSAEEFEKVVRETALGFSLPEALDHLVQRINSDDLAMIVTAINIQHEVGGNLAQTFEAISETIRERVRLKGEISVITTQQRMTGLMLSGMPFIIGTILMLINPEYMMTIFEPRWLFIPITALVMMVIGNLIIRRIVSQEF